MLSPTQALESDKNLPSNGSSWKKSDNCKRKIVMFTQDEALTETYEEDEEGYRRIVAENSVVILESCMGHLGEEELEVSVTPSKKSLESKVSNGLHSDLPLTSFLNKNEVVSIYLSPQPSMPLSNQEEMEVLRTHSCFEIDANLEVFTRVAEEEDLEILRPQPNSLVFRRERSRVREILNCLIFRADKSFELKLEVLGLSNEIRLEMVEGKLQDFQRCKELLKRRLWELNLVKVTEIECIGFVVENSAPQLSELTTRITEIARQPLVPPFVEIAMQMVVNIRIQVVNEAKQRGFFQNIVVEDFVDTTLFRDMNLFNLYSQFQEENEREFQNKRQKLLQEWGIQQQFQYLQISSHPQLCPSSATSSLPFSQAIEQLNKINTSLSPAQKHQVILTTHNLIKKSLLHHPHPIDPSSTSPILQTLPVLMLVMLHSSASCIYANLVMVQHFLEATGETEGRKVLDDMVVSVEYITHSWS